MKWNKVCPICKREIPDEKIRNIIPLPNTETAAPVLTSNNNTSDPENVPLLVSTLHGSSRYGSVAENSDEGFNDQHLLEPAVHTSEQYHQLRSSSESNDALSDAESYHLVAM